jgi:uncharacterized protein
MKFVADVMLGRLARMMRFHGYDVEYDNKATDEQLLQRSRYRILLTKDRELHQRANRLNVYFVQNVGAKKQLIEIQNQFPDQQKETRCIECNEKLRVVRKQKVAHLVPPFIFQQQKRFLQCPQCARIYWMGTHYQQMMRMLK